MPSDATRSHPMWLISTLTAANVSSFCPRSHRRQRPGRTDKDRIPASGQAHALAYVMRQTRAAGGSSTCWQMVRLAGLPRSAPKYARCSPMGRPGAARSALRRKTAELSGVFCSSAATRSDYHLRAGEPGAGRRVSAHSLREPRRAPAERAMFCRLVPDDIPRVCWSA